jgi:hypothetical protein
MPAGVKFYTLISHDVFVAANSVHPCFCAADYCEADWNAAFVHSFDRYERQQQHAEQRSSYWQAHRPGGQEDPFQTFQEMFKDPFSWFERM